MCMAYKEQNVFIFKTAGWQSTTSAAKPEVRVGVKGLVLKSISGLHYCPFFTLNIFSWNKRGKINNVACAEAHIILNKVRTEALARSIHPRTSSLTVVSLLNGFKNHSTKTFKSLHFTNTLKNKNALRLEAKRKKRRMNACLLHLDHGLKFNGIGSKFADPVREFLHSHSVLIVLPAEALLIQVYLLQIAVLCWKKDHARWKSFKRAV